MKKIAEEKEMLLKQEQAALRKVGKRKDPLTGGKKNERRLK